MPPELPPELFDDIFSNLLASLDYASLYACTEVSSSFRSLAEPHLYRHLTISDGGAYYDKFPVTLCKASFYRGDSPSQVLKLLSDKPHIVSGGYVRSLKLLIVAERGVISKQKRIWWNEETARLLHLLTKLERLEVRQGMNGWLSWKRLSEDLQLGLEHVLSLPSMREVGMCNFSFPLEILRRSPSLQMLEVSSGDVSFGIQGQEVSLTTISEERQSLSSLVLMNPKRTANYSSIISWLNSNIGPDISKLRYFKASLYEAGDYKQVSYILSLCSGSLERLTLVPEDAANVWYEPSARDRDEVHILAAPGAQPYVLDELQKCFFYSTPSSLSSSNRESMSSSFSLSCLSSLTHLTLCLEMGKVTRPSTVILYTAPFEFVRRILEGVQPAPQDLGDSGHGYGRVPLKHLVLEITFGTEMAVYVDRISWLPLASALSAFSEMMPLLEVVELRAIIRGSAEKAEEIAGDLKNAVRMLKANVHFIPLIATGLVRLSGKRLDKDTGEFVDVI